MRCQIFPRILIYLLLHLDWSSKMSLLQMKHNLSSKKMVTKKWGFKGVI